MRPEELLSMAKEAMMRAYAPYSGFYVGAALLTKSGNVYTGCNIENAAFSPTNCAERTAFFKAVSDGEREFAAIAVVGGKGGVITGLCSPCGVCRQVMQEFCGPEFVIYMGKEHDGFEACTLQELLPFGFAGEDHLLKLCETVKNP